MKQIKKVTVYFDDGTFVEIPYGGIIPDCVPEYKCGVCGNMHKMGTLLCPNQIFTTCGGVSP